MTIKNNEQDAAKKAEYAVQIAHVENDIAELQHELDNPPELELYGQANVEYSAQWKNHSVRDAKLTVNRGIAFSKALGQCTQVLKDKMKHDPDYTSTMDACSPLLLKKLIEKTILSQSDDQYP